MGLLFKIRSFGTLGMLGWHSHVAAVGWSWLGLMTVLADAWPARAGSPLLALVHLVGLPRDPPGFHFPWRFRLQGLTYGCPCVSVSVEFGFFWPPVTTQAWVTGHAFQLAFWVGITVIESFPGRWFCGECPLSITYNFLCGNQP